MIKQRYGNTSYRENNRSNTCWSNICRSNDTVNLTPSLELSQLRNLHLGELRVNKRFFHSFSPSTNQIYSNSTQTQANSTKTKRINHHIEYIFPRTFTLLDLLKQIQLYFVKQLMP
jgi:hypothetical protein